MMSDVAGQGGIFGDMTVEQIINSMINGRPIFDTDSIIKKNLTDLFSDGSQIVSVHRLRDTGDA